MANNASTNGVRGDKSVFGGGNQQHPDIMCELFILAPTDFVDDHEIRDGGRSFAA